MAVDVEEEVEIQEEVFSEFQADKKDLSNFAWEDYQSFIPIEHKEKLAELFTTQKFGWKTQARRLIQAKLHYNMYRQRLDDMVQDITREDKGRGRGAMTPQSHLKAYLRGLTDTQLQKLCAEKNVSWASFMKSNDKTGLLAALFDEMIPKDEE